MLFSLIINIQANKNKIIKINNQNININLFNFNPKNKYLILLHGVRADTDRMLPFIKVLENKFNIISIDLPGYSLSNPYNNTKLRYLNYSSEILSQFIEKLDISKENIIFAGFSLGANILIEFIYKNVHSEDFQHFYLFSPFYSSHNLLMSQIKYKFTNWYLSELSKNQFPTKIFQYIINSDKLFNLFAKIFDKTSRKNKKIFEYEKKQWRLMKVHHLASNLLELFNLNYNNQEVINSRNITFAFPESEEYLDINKVTENFKVKFPNSNFKSYEGKEHMPRGNFLDDYILMNKVKKITEIIK